jgi:hypothetical protein
MLLVLQVICLHQRVGKDKPRWESMERLVDVVRGEKQANPGRAVEVYFLDRDVEHARVYLEVLGLLSRDQIHLGMDPPPPDRHVTQIRVRQERYEPYQITVVQP